MKKVKRDSTRPSRGRKLTDEDQERREREADEAIARGEVSEAFATAEGVIAALHRDAAAR